MRVFPDTNIVIYLIERHPIFGPPTRSALAKWRPKELVSSVFVRFEALVMPIRNGDVARIADFQRFFTAGSIRVPLYDTVFDIAAELRAKYVSLKTPDALNLATAIESGCDFYLTNDKRLRVVTEIRVEVI